MNTKSKATLVKILTPIGILLIGAVGAASLIASGKSAQKLAPEPAVAAVDVVVVQPSSVPAQVQATGVVKPDREVSVIPQVSGQIVSVSPALLPGGRLEAGALLAQIDPRDYRLAVRQEESRVAQAQVEFQLEEGRQVTAQREWALLGDGRAASEAPLALRRPQRAAAAQSLASAQAGLERAQLNLARTSLVAPFNAMVLSESAEVGQVVGGAAVARLVGTDRFRVQVSVPFEQLGVLDIPGVNAEQGSPATVRQVLSDGTLERSGQIIALAGELDPQTRSATLLVAIDDPMESGPNGLPLLPGAFVDVTLYGRAIDGAYVVPRAALYGGDTLWLVDPESRLGAVKVTTRWGDEEDVVVTGGLEPGAQVVVSPLSLPIVGAPVRAAAL